MTQEQFESSQEQLDQDLQAEDDDDGNDMLAADDLEDDDPSSLQQEAQADLQVCPYKPCAIFWSTAFADDSLINNLGTNLMLSSIHPQPASSQVKSLHGGNPVIKIVPMCAGFNLWVKTLLL